MRFSSILFALPLIGSAFAAPAPALKDRDAIAQTGCTGTCKDALDLVVGVFVELKAKIDVVVPAGKLVAVADVDLALTTITDSCTSALAILEADVNLKAKLTLLSPAEKEIIAEAIANVILDINVVLKAIDAKIAVDVKVKALLVKLNAITTKLLLKVEGLIAGIIKLALNICVKLSVNLKLVISPLFTSLTIDLKLYLVGIVGIVIGLLGIL